MESTLILISLLIVGWPRKIGVRSRLMAHYREPQLNVGMLMTPIVSRCRTFAPLFLACVAFVAATPSGVLAQIVGPGVYDWGKNTYGQLGNGTTSGGAANPTPILVTAGGLSGVDVTAAAGGANHSLAVTSIGTVYAWGDNTFGQLGNGNTTDSSTPIAVTGLSGVNVKSVAGGAFHSLAATNTGAVYAWGEDNFGQAGNGTQTNSVSTPIPVTGGGLSGVNVTAVAAGDYHSLALTSTGTVYAWGFNFSGQLGNGSTTDSYTPVAVSALSGLNVRAIAGGGIHSLAVTNAGAVYAWGANNNGQLGNGTTSNSSTPVQVEGAGGIGLLSNVTAVAAGDSHSLALTNTGAVYAWGNNGYGQLGNGTTTDSSAPLLLSFPANGSATVVSIAAGYENSFALESDGSLWAWGDNSYGQYGNGPTPNNLTPTEVFTPTGGYGITMFAEGELGRHSLAIVSPIPEPGSLCLVAGVAGLAGIRRLRRGCTSGVKICFHPR